MSTVRLRPSVEPFPASTGDIYLLRSDGGGDVVLRDADPFARDLVDALAEGVRPAGRSRPHGRDHAAGGGRCGGAGLLRSRRFRPVPG